METIGSFLKGAVAGVAALGLLSWFIATQCEDESEDSTAEEE